MPEFVLDGPDDAAVTILLAHGAGAPMDSPSMTAFAQALAARGMRVARFEFGYMGARRTEGRRKPPPKAETLVSEYAAAIEALDTPGTLVVGGKSMGGRVASLGAGAWYEAGRIAGLLCLGYPFHPPGRPGTTRVAHLETIRVPTLICQGTRDPFGTAGDVAGYRLPQAVRVMWIEDGDHDLKPRKRETGRSHGEAIAMMADAVRAWATGLSEG